MRKKPKRRQPWVHHAAALLTAAVGAYRELFGEIPKTGQSLDDLMRAHWTWWEVHRFFPVTALNLLIPAGLVIVIALHSVKGRESK